MATEHQLKTPKSAKPAPHGLETIAARIPADVARRMQERLREKGFVSISEYLRDLIRKDAARSGEEVDCA